MKKLPALVLALVLVDSLHFIFGRLLVPYLPPTTSSFLYMSVGLVQIAIYAAATRQIDGRVFRDNARFFTVIGFLIALATVVSYTAVVYIDPGTAALIGRMGTIFGLGFGVFWLKERLSRGERIGAVIAVIGALIISFQWGDSGSLAWLGALLVLISTFCYSLHAAIVKRSGSDIDFTNFFLFRMVTSCFFLLVFTVARGELILPTGRDVWIILILTGTINVTVSRSLYYIVLRRVPLSILTIFLTLTPVMTIMWSLVLFDVLPSTQALLGGVAVISGVLMVTLSRRHNRPKPA
jgi:drug/metabolite transporter (DMT)-like permease